MDGSTHSEPIDESVVGNIGVTVYGERCACGHTTIVTRDSGRIASVEVSIRQFAHHIRHPFKEKTPASEWIREAPDVDIPLVLAAGFTAAYDTIDEEES
jgi:hypothetical protein